jgi:long-chain acyl-CoA synthetase
MHLTAGLHRSMQRHPDKIATVTGTRRQTYRQLVDRVARTASVLRALGLQPGERLSVLALNSDRMMELLLAGAWAGLVINPINTRWTAAEVAYALGDCSASALAVDGGLMATAQAITQPLPALRQRLYIGEAQAPAGYLPLEAQLTAASPMEDVRSAPDTLAAIVYTGGTTGFPKGVMLSHGNLWASLLGRMAEVPNPPHYVTLLTSPMFHVAGLGRMLGQTIVGGTCVTVPSCERPGHCAQHAADAAGHPRLRPAGPAPAGAHFVGRGADHLAAAAACAGGLPPSGLHPCVRHDRNLGRRHNFADFPRPCLSGQ